MARRQNATEGDRAGTSVLGFPASRAELTQSCHPYHFVTQPEGAQTRELRAALPGVVPGRPGVSHPVPHGTAPPSQAGLSLRRAPARSGLCEAAADLGLSRHPSAHEEPRPLTGNRDSPGVPWSGQCRTVAGRGREPQRQTWGLGGGELHRMWQQMLWGGGGGGGQGAPWELSYMQIWV